MTHRFQTSSPSSKTNHCKILTRRSFPNTCAFWHSNLHLPLSSAGATPCTYHAHICNNTFLMASMRDQDLAHSLMLCLILGCMLGSRPVGDLHNSNQVLTVLVPVLPGSIPLHATYMYMYYIPGSARSSYRYRGYELMILASAGYLVWAIAISSDC